MSIIMLNGKDSDNCLFYGICYAIQYEKTEKADNCLYQELQNNLPNDLFSSLNSIKSQLALDLDF